MEKVDEIRLSTDADAEGRSLIGDAQGRTGPFTEGTSLVAQFRAGERYLLLLSEDWPLEEHHYLLLLDAQLALLDEIVLGRWYVPSALRDVSVEAGDVTFRIYGQRWRVHVHDAPKPWPYWLCPRGARRRKPFAARYLELRVIEAK